MASARASDLLLTTCDFSPNSVNSLRTVNFLVGQWFANFKNHLGAY